MKTSHIETKAVGASLLLLLVATVAPASMGQTSSKSKAPAKTAKAPATATKPAQSSMGPAYNAYISALRTKMDNNWYLADGKNRVTLELRVAEDGGVTDLNVSSTPKNSEAEQAASDAFNKSQPLPALPSGSPPVKMTLVFSSTADPHGDNTRDITGRIDPIVQTKKTESTGESDNSNNSQTRDASSK